MQQHDWRPGAGLHVMEPQALDHEALPGLRQRLLGAPDESPIP